MPEISPNIASNFDSEAPIYSELLVTLNPHPAQEPDHREARQAIIAVLGEHHHIPELTATQYSYIVREATQFARQAPNREAEVARFRSAAARLITIADRSAERAKLMSQL